MSILNLYTRAIFVLVIASTCGRAQVTFPLTVSGNGRYLQTPVGQPFLVVADSAWNLMSLSPANQAFYMDARKAQGFNTLLVAGVTGPYIGTAFTDSSGHAPFGNNSDFSTTNATYFNNVVAMVALAQSKNMLLLFYPMETGYWLFNSANNASLTGPMVANGVGKCRAFGSYIGNLLKGFPNLIWSYGNDANQALMDAGGNAYLLALKAGIESVTQVSSLNTIELGSAPGQSPVDFGYGWGNSESTDDPSWKNVSKVNWGYWYIPTSYPAHRYSANGSDIPNNPIPIIPNVLGEGTYENDTAGTWPGVAGTPLVIRKASWSWILSGGLGGTVYGNNRVWTFPYGWSNNLQSPGAIHTGQISSFMGKLPWNNLVPDFSHTIVTSGYGTEFSGGLWANPSSGPLIVNDHYVSVSYTASGVVIAYAQANSTLNVNLSGFTGTAFLFAQWYDPTTNAFTPIGTYPSGTGAPNQIFRSSNNAAGDPDMVLLLTPTSVVNPTPTPHATPTPVTMGVTSIGTLADRDNGNLVCVQSASLSLSATITSLSFYVRTIGGSLVLGLYSDASGAPGSLLASTAVFTPSSTGWNMQPVTKPIALMAGNYWLAYFPSSNNLGFWIGRGGSWKINSVPFSGTLPSNFTVTGSGNGGWSFYATLMPSQ
jgi:hypothetical protein